MTRRQKGEDMTMAEFNAWLEGFEASFDGGPTEAQWKKVKAKLEAVTFHFFTSPVYPVTPYPPALPWYWPGSTWTTADRSSTTCGANA